MREPTSHPEPSPDPVNKQAEPEQSELYHTEQAAAKPMVDADEFRQQWRELIQTLLSKSEDEAIALYGRTAAFIKSFRNQYGNDVLNNCAYYHVLAGSSTWEPIVCPPKHRQLHKKLVEFLEAEITRTNAEKVE